MALIKWRDSFSVGVPRFDDDHKILLDILNEMFIIVRDQKGINYITVEINKLTQYTQEHFANEEAAMEKIGYPALDDHKTIHAKPLENVHLFKERIDNGDTQATTTFYHFLRKWLLTHIVEVDMQYKPFLTDSEDMTITD